MSDYEGPDPSPAGRLVTGLVAGIAFSWGAIFAAFVLSLGASGSDGGPAWLGVVVFLIAPVVSLALLVRAKTRTAFLIGLAIGSIIGAGACASYLRGLG